MSHSQPVKIPACQQYEQRLQHPGKIPHRLVALCVCGGARSSTVSFKYSCALACLGTVQYM
eukprot:1293890-Amphidinium_carterae.1